MIKNGFVPETPSVTAMERAFEMATSKFVDKDHEKRHNNPLSKLFPDAMFCWGLEVGLTLAAIMAEEAATKNVSTAVN